MGVAEDVPGVRGIYLGEEVITVDIVSKRDKTRLKYLEDAPVADKQTRLVTRQLAMEEYLRRLRHAADSTRGEVS